jgi:N-acetyl sugar amidotransferase
VTKTFQICSRCVLDTTSSDVTFDSNGICNYCHQNDLIAASTYLRPREDRYKDFAKIISEIKVAGEGKKYDCILGLSGGMDSSYMALVAHEQGLRPLVIHFDNGWNAELAVKNIESIVSKLSFDLHTYVINWEEFKDLQLSYLKASVIDIEVPTDQLIFATLYKLAKEYKIKYILSGNNVVTELSLPADWCFRGKLDYTNLKHIHDKYGKIKLKDFPRLSLYDRFYYDEVLKIKQVHFFNYIDFDVKTVRERLEKELGWVNYKGKHYESVWTRFYQGYILPTKFNVDKRKAHLSSMICSGQITREEALKELEQPPYSERDQKEDKIYVLKKFGLSEDEFNAIMSTPVVKHETFGLETDQGFKMSTFLLYKRLYKWLSERPLEKLVNKFKSH